MIKASASSFLWNFNQFLPIGINKCISNQKWLKHEHAHTNVLAHSFAPISLCEWKANVILFKCKLIMLFVCGQSAIRCTDQSHNISNHLMECWNCCVNALYRIASTFVIFKLTTSCCKPEDEVKQCPRIQTLNGPNNLCLMRLLCVKDKSEAGRVRGKVK